MWDLVKLSLSVHDYPHLLKKGRLWQKTRRDRKYSFVLLFNAKLSEIES